MDIKSLRGLVVSGKMLAGKDTFLELFRKCIGGATIANAAFADKLKLLCKYLLVRLAATKDAELVADEVSHIVLDEILLGEVSFAELNNKILSVVKAPYTAAYAKKGIQFPNLDRLRDWDPHSPRWVKTDCGFENIDGILWSDCGKPRELMQRLGTDVLRSFDNDVWVSYLFRVLGRYPGQFHVVSDGRFPDELDASREHGFLDVRIEADEEIRLARGLERDGQDYRSAIHHIGETVADDYDFSVVIANNGTKSEFLQSIWDNPLLRELCLQMRRRAARESLIRAL